MVRAPRKISMALTNRWSAMREAAYVWITCIIMTAAIPTTAVGEDTAEDASERGCQREQRRCRLKGLTAIEREQLSALPERESYLFELQLNQRELQSLGRLSWMRRLDLSRSQIKNLEPITSLARLSELRVDGIKEGRLSLKPLSALSQLKRLSFASTRVSDEAEIATNPRSRSAKLRAVRKLQSPPR